MSFIDEIKNKAKENIKTIILPESEDVRVLSAASKIMKEEFAKVILIGNEVEAKEDVVVHRANLEITKTATSLRIKPGDTFKYTVQKWLTPKGHSIDKKGVAPTLEVKLELGENEALTEENDVQLKKAIEIASTK